MRKLGLRPSQTFDTVRAFADKGGIEAQLYDALIGQAAIVDNIPCIVTWNIRHVSGLFPHLAILTPRAFLARR